MTNNIFVYWQNHNNQETPTYVELCYDSIEKNSNCTLHRINQQNVFDYLPDLRKDLFNLESMPQICEYVRLKLLEKYGGIYLDSDCVVLRDMSFLFDMFNSEKTFVGVRDHDNFIINAFMSCLPNAPIITKTIAESDMILNENPTTKVFSWNIFGSHILGRVVDDTCHFLDRELFTPIRWQDSMLFDCNNSIDNYINQDTVTFMLWGEMFRRGNMSVLKMDTEELLKSPSLIGQIFRKALS